MTKSRIFHELSFRAASDGTIAVCNCSWTSKALGQGEDVIRLLRAEYVAHLPLDQRKRGLKINLYPGDMGYEGDEDENGEERQGMPMAGCWILPALEPVNVMKTYQADVFYGITEDGETLPILWIKLQDGRIFQTE